MKQLILTGLGNEVDISSGKTVFTAIFNGSLRVPITEEGAQALTKHLWGKSEEQETSPVEIEQPAYPMEPTFSAPVIPEDEDDGETFGGDMVTGAPVLTEMPNSVYDEDTGVEQV